MSYLIHEAASAHPIHTSAGTDYKAWAKRILYREARNDNTLLPIQVKFAQQALEVQQDKS